MDEPATLDVRLALDDAEPDELAVLTSKLRRRLLEVDVDAVDHRAADPPPGAKAVEAIALGALAVTLARSAGVLAAVIRATQSWLSGETGRRVKLELDGDSIELTGVSSRDQQRLIDAWIERHAAG